MRYESFLTWIQLCLALTLMTCTLFLLTYFMLFNFLLNPCVAFVMWLFNSFHLFVKRRDSSTIFIVMIATLFLLSQLFTFWKKSDLVLWLSQVNDLSLNILDRSCSSDLRPHFRNVRKVEQLLFCLFLHKIRYSYALTFLYVYHLKKKHV